MRAYLGLGSNLGDREGYLQQACELLLLSGAVHIMQASAIYETEPWGLKDQPVFWNQVIEIETSLTPKELLSLCLGIENRLGRRRRIHWGPRTIDIDILVYDNISCQTPDLTLPHPEIENREFVLAPLREVNPRLILPSGKSVSEVHGSDIVRKMI